MRRTRIFGEAVGGPDLVVEDVTIEVETRQERKRTVAEEVLVFRVRPKAAQARRCSQCRAVCPGYDAGVGLRRWRTLDVGTTKAYLEAQAPRVSCPEHGVVVAHVPWARPGAKCSTVFEDTCAWLAAHTALSVLTALLRVAWRTVAAIVARVVADGRDTNDLLAGLTRIGIDEISMTGVRAGRAIEPRNVHSGVPTLSQWRKATSAAAVSRGAVGPRVVKEPGHVRNLHVREPGDPAPARPRDQRVGRPGNAEAVILG